MPETIDVISSKIVDFNDKNSVGLNEKSPGFESEAFKNRVCADTNGIDVIMPDPAIKCNAGKGMSKNFIMLNRCEETLLLLRKHPNAFLLLTQIAERARRYDGHPDGLKIGECHIGDYKNCGLTEQKYRTAKSILEKKSYIKIIETCRNRKKSTTGSTTEGTLVKLLSSVVYDINIESGNDLINDRATTGQRPGNDEQDRIKIDKIEKEERKNIKKEKFSKPEKIAFGKIVQLSIEEYEKLCNDHAKNVVDKIIESMNDYCESKGKTYSSYSAAIRQWVRNQKNKTVESKNGQSPKDAIRERQLAEYANNNGSFNDCVKRFD